MTWSAFSVHCTNHINPMLYNFLQGTKTTFD